jgi:tRNA (guanine37-N1)-methyltransferase
MKRAGGVTINFLTLFPELISGAFAGSILKRAQEKGLFSPRLINIRDYARDRHHTADDKPFGGGQGMVMKPEPIARALAALKRPGRMGKVYLLSPAGKIFDQARAQALAKAKAFTLICGRYEGVDERVARNLCDGEISIGSYVLSGGEPAAAVIADAVVRLIPGVLGDELSAAEDSFSDGLLEHPQYTRPARYRGWQVPDILLSGDHRRVEEWRRQQRLLKTLFVRPDLLAAASLTAAEQTFLQDCKQDQKSLRIRRRRRKS